MSLTLDEIIQHFEKPVGKNTTTARIMCIRLLTAYYANPKFDTCELPHITDLLYKCCSFDFMDSIGDELLIKGLQAYLQNPKFELSRLKDVIIAQMHQILLLVNAQGNVK